MNDTKTVHFVVDFDGLRAEVKVDFYGAEVLLGISVEHQEPDSSSDRARHAPTLVVRSRTEPILKHDTDSVLRRGVNERTYIARNNDAFLASVEAIDWHIGSALPEFLKVADRFKTEVELREKYADMVMSPICTAVVGLCRSATLRQALEDSIKVKAIGTWAMGDNRPKPERVAESQMVLQIQDVILKRES